jgi:hypothetical protein
MKIIKWFRNIVLGSIIMTLFTVFTSSILNITFEDPIDTVSINEPGITIKSDEWPPIGW